MGPVVPRVTSSAADEFAPLPYATVTMYVPADQVAGSAARTVPAGVADASSASAVEPSVIAGVPAGAFDSEITSTLCVKSTAALVSANWLVEPAEEFPLP